MTSVRYLNPKSLSAPPGYTHVVEVTGPGRTVYIAGQVGIDRNGHIAGGPGDVRAQIVQAFENLKAALAEVGATFDDVVKITNYLVDGAHVQDYREIRDRLCQQSRAAGEHAAHHLAAGARGLAVRDRCGGGAAGEMIRALE
jgi:enamine deaminase RidA (YjgF/YER057c/UK114 family)